MFIGGDQAMWAEWCVPPKSASCVLKSINPFAAHALGGSRKCCGKQCKNARGGRVKPFAQVCRRDEGCPQRARATPVTRCT
eukprot:12134266-Karenia_brevis.AAC.1